MLVVPVLGVHRPDSPPMSEEVPEDPPAVVSRMETASREACDAEVTGMLLEIYHDAREAREEVDQLMRLGFLNLDLLAHTDSLYWSTCREVLRKLTAAELTPPPTEQLQLEEQLTDLYLGDFSVFHSIIDHWAIGQVFPVMPLHRLDQRPLRRAQLVDLTCDSDGKIDQYVVGHGNSSWLPLHDHRSGEPYYLGIFLVGAYQEILGDAHNLLGRVDEVHVYARADASGNFWIEESLKGISVKDMLGQVQYFSNDLDRRMSELVRKQINAGVIKAADATKILNNYTKRLDESTYCTTEVLK
jgi:arginine decarboxylase